MESSLQMEDEQLCYYTQSPGFFNIVCFYIGCLNFFPRWTVFMVRPICVSVISDAVTQNA